MNVSGYNNNLQITYDRNNLLALNVPSSLPDMLLNHIKSLGIQPQPPSQVPRCIGTSIPRRTHRGVKGGRRKGEMNNITHQHLRKIPKDS